MFIGYYILLYHMILCFVFYFVMLYDVIYIYWFYFISYVVTLYYLYIYTYKSLFSVYKFNVLVYCIRILYYIMLYYVYILYDILFCFYSICNFDIYIYIYIYIHMHLYTPPKKDRNVVHHYSSRISLFYQFLGCHIFLSCNDLFVTPNAPPKFVRCLRNCSSTSEPFLHGIKGSKMHSEKGHVMAM